MKFDEVVSNLAKNDYVDINGGAIVLKKKVSEVIGGIPVYNIMVDRVKDKEEPLTFETMDGLDDFSIGNMQGISICRCCECGSFPEKGYYHDFEMEQDYCSFECVLKWFNQVWGLGNWNTMLGGDFDDFQIWVKVSEEQVVGLDSFKKVDGEYWRKYNLKYIPPYDFSCNSDDVE